MAPALRSPAGKIVHRMRTTICALLLATLSTTPLLAQAAPSDADRFVTAALATSSAYDTLEELTDDIGARPSGSANAAAAVRWAVERFRSWGIDVHEEKVMVPHWVRGIETATLVSQRDQKIVLTALGNSIGTPADGITAEVLELTSFDELKTLGREKIEGKIVFFHVPMDMEKVRHGKSFDAYSDAVVYRALGPSRAAEYGAKAVLIRSVASASLRTPHTGALRYDEKQPRIPAAAMTTEDALLVHRLLAKGETVRMHLTLTPQMLPDVESANVVAEIRGSEKPDEIVLIAGHLDSWDLATGAIDDGSGVAMVMETMRLLRQLGIRPKRTIRAVLYMNEENGTRGGRQYAADHKSELAKHVAAIETDAGASAPTGYTTTLTGDALTALEARTTALARVGAATFETEKDTGADTSFLTAAGVPGFGLVPDPLHYFDYHHTPADTLDKIDPKELAADTAAIGVLAIAIAEQ
jgi:carboxypeptidase Q